MKKNNKGMANLLFGIGLFVLLISLLAGLYLSKNKKGEPTPEEKFCMDKYEFQLNDSYYIDYCKVVVCNNETHKVVDNFCSNDDDFNYIPLILWMSIMNND